MVLHRPVELAALTRTQRDFCHNFRVADNPSTIRVHYFNE